VCNELVVLLFSGMEESGVSVVRAARVCGRCFQPSRSTVVRCTSSAVPGGIDLCRRCHSFVHPGCGATLAAVADRAAAAAAAARPPCVLCRGLDATLLCPAVSERRPRPPLRRPVVRRLFRVAARRRSQDVSCRPHRDAQRMIVRNTESCIPYTVVMLLTFKHRPLTLSFQA